MGLTRPPSTGILDCLALAKTRAARLRARFLTDEDEKRCAGDGVLRDQHDTDAVRIDGRHRFASMPEAT